MQVVQKQNKWKGLCTYFRLKRIDEKSPVEWQKPEWKQRPLQKCFIRPTAKDKSDLKKAYKAAKGWPKV